MVAPLPVARDERRAVADVAGNYPPRDARRSPPGRRLGGRRSRRRTEVQEPVAIRRRLPWLGRRASDRKCRRRHEKRSASACASTGQLGANRPGRRRHALPHREASALCAGRRCVRGDGGPCPAAVRISSGCAAAGAPYRPVARERSGECRRPRRAGRRGVLARPRIAIEAATDRRGASACRVLEVGARPRWAECAFDLHNVRRRPTEQTGHRPRPGHVWELGFACFLRTRHVDRRRSNDRRHACL